MGSYKQLLEKAHSEFVMKIDPEGLGQNYELQYLQWAFNILGSANAFLKYPTELFETYEDQCVKSYMAFLLMRVLELSDENFKIESLYKDMSSLQLYDLSGDPNMIEQLVIARIQDSFGKDFSEAFGYFQYLKETIKVEENRSIFLIKGL